MNKPILGIALFFTVGITLGRYLTFPFLPLYLALLTFFGLFLIFYLKKKKVLLSSSLFILFLLIGVLRFHYAYFPHSPSHILRYAPSQEKVKLTGKVLNHPQLKERTIRFIMEAKKISLEEERRTEGRVWIVCYFPLENYSYGDTVKVEGKLSLPEGARKKGEFNWQRYLSYRGIWVELYTGKVDVIKRGGGSFLIKWAYKSRDWIVRVIEHTLPSPHSAVLKGIMLGDRESLPLEVRESFLRTGTGHILVVSGLHVGLILFLLLILFRVLALPSKLAFLITIPLLGGYALLTGFRLPVSRATLMASVGLVALIINRETPLLAILSSAFLIILFLNPLALFMASFQLSFAAVGGIIYLTPHLEALGNSIASRMRDNTSSGDASQKMKLKKPPPWLGKSLAISLAAQLSILPLLAFYFNRLPLIGVLTNLIVAPLISIILALGFLSVGLSLVSLGLAEWVAASEWLTISLLLKITGFLSFSQPNILSNLICPYVKPFPSWLLLVYYSALVALPYFCKLAFSHFSLSGGEIRREKLLKR